MIVYSNDGNARCPFVNVENADQAVDSIKKWVAHWCENAIVMYGPHMTTVEALSKSGNKVSLVFDY